MLLLDEPTNDLDIPTLRVLEDYLDSYQGCLMVVSHDRYFLDRTVEYIFAFEENGTIRRYPGNYTLYLELKALESKSEQKSVKKVVEAPKPVVPALPKQSKLSSKEKRELEQLERSIQVAESRQSEIAAQLASTGADFTLQQKLGSELQSLQQQLEKEMVRWSALAEQA